MLIPENELEIKFVRSSGPGGQNVNRRETKVQVRWNINKSQIFTEEQKEQIRERLKGKITKENDIIVESNKTRYQLKNKETAVWQLNELVNRALKKEKENCYQAKQIGQRKTIRRKKEKIRNQKIPPKNQIFLSYFLQLLQNILRNRNFFTGWAYSRIPPGANNP